MRKLAAVSGLSALLLTGCGGGSSGNSNSDRGSDPTPTGNIPAMDRLLIGGTGLYILWRRWREAVRLQQAQYERLKQEENNSQQDE